MNTAKRTRLAPALAALCALVLLPLLAGCGEKEEVVGGEVKTQGFNLALDFTPNPNHAGIFTGIDTETFLDRALVVKTQIPPDPAAVIQQVISGRADAGISYQNEVMAAREKGAKIKAVAAIVPTPLNSIMWLKKSDVKSIKDLKGKRVGISGAYGGSLLKTILTKNGVDPDSVKTINVGFDLEPALLSGKVDAVTDVYWNIQGVQLDLRNRPVTVIPVDKEGVPRYDELVLIASETALGESNKSEKLRRFIAGLQDGTAAAVADPALAQRSVLGADEALGAKFVKASLAETLPVLEYKNTDQPYGYMNPADWTSFANWMRDNALLETAPDAASAFTNELLPPLKAN